MDRRTGSTWPLSTLTLASPEQYPARIISGQIICLAGVPSQKDLLPGEGAFSFKNTGSSLSKQYHSLVRVPSLSLSSADLGLECDLAIGYTSENSKTLSPYYSIASSLCSLLPPAVSKWHAKTLRYSIMECLFWNRSAKLRSPWAQVDKLFTVSALVHCLKAHLGILSTSKIHISDTKITKGQGNPSTRGVIQILTHQTVIQTVHIHMCSNPSCYTRKW